VKLGLGYLWSLLAPQPADAQAVALARKIALSRLALAWERVWPVLLWPLVLVGAIVVTALFGLWNLLTPWMHYAGIGIFLVGLGTALAPLARLGWPTRGEARARLDAAADGPHRPATALEDELADGDAGVLTTALWQVHKRRMAAAAAMLRVRAPHPRLIERDPIALRVALTLALVVAAAYAGPTWQTRLSDALIPNDGVGGEPLRLDAWIAPPVYTGKAPIFLADGSNPLTAVRAPEGPVDVPGGSELVLRFHGQRTSEAALTPSGRGDAQIFTFDGDDAAGEFRARIDANAVLTVTRPGGEDLAWTFRAIKDLRPEIALAEDLTTTDDQALKLVYTVSDDYGVVGAEARFSKADDGGSGSPPAPATADAPRLEIAPPDFALVLPGVRVRDATGEMFRDLTAHPWAGLEAALTLVARDEAGQEGRSHPIRLTLPERRFLNPLAKAVIEQRRDLVRRPDTGARVARALNALTIAPELFIEDMSVYLALRTAYFRLRSMASNEEFRDVVDLLWDVALRIEDGDLSLAERELRAAQDALARALAEGASDEEIERLMNELRQAMSRFMEALRQQAEALGQIPEVDGRMLETHDLSRMMDMIEQLANSGARDAAQQLLAQLQSLLENLNGAMMTQLSPEQSLMSEMLGEIGRMIAEQQRLMDETYRQGPGQGESQDGTPRPGQEGRPDEGGRGEFAGREGEGDPRAGRPGELQSGRGNAPGMSLADEQQALREQLQALRDQLARGGVQPPSQLDRAGREMGEAEEDLRADDNNSAVDDQREALDQLRQGAQSMAQQLAQGLQPGGGPGPGQPGPSAENGLTDPLGRPMRSSGPEFGLTVKVPDEIDAESARRLREELQRRLGDTFRRSLELDYIERLLELF
jgi:uncharacterized protein (TIGR02302 family)